MQFDNVMYNKTFISIIIAFIKFNKNIKIKEKIKVSIKITSKNANNKDKNDFNDDDYNFLFIKNILNVYRQQIL